MYQVQIRSRNCAADDELIDVLTTISVVSMRLARKLALLAGQSKSMEGEKTDEQNEQFVYDYRRVAQCRYRY